MLDRFKLITQVSQKANLIDSNQDLQLNLALGTWQAIITDPTFKTKLLAANLPFSVPAWLGELGEMCQLEPQKIDYTVVSCDGSQVYPDRHMGSNFYLINTGLIVLRYHASSSVAVLSTPYFFTDIKQAIGSIADYVDSKRHELEMQDGYQAVLQELESQVAPSIYLVDGSLIAWHLFGKSDDLREQFLPTYLAQLTLFLDQSVPVVGYVSLPNSTDLINLLRAKLSDFNLAKSDIKKREHPAVSGEAWEPVEGFASQQDINQQSILPELTDSDLLAAILPAGCFTVWFASQVAAIKDYPQDLKIYFTYYNTGHEIARIEVPAFVFASPVLLKLSMQVVVDQVTKGYGYPVALSEAHQQAVIKSQDRDFFYQVIRQFSPAKNHTGQISRKLRYKQTMSF